MAVAGCRHDAEGRPAETRRRTPGRGRAGAVPAHSDPKQKVECDAINDLANNRAARPPLAIVPADPILVKGAAVKSDPAAVAGAFGGAYGECKTTTVTRPATYEEEVCNEFKALGEQVCHKVLNVTIRTDSVCVMGTYEYPYTFNPHDIGVEKWRIDSLCAGGKIRVQCWSGGYQNRSLTIPLNRTDITPMYGASCYPHTHYPGIEHWFYYSHQSCDGESKLCTATLYDVPGWDPYRYACPAGQVDCEPGPAIPPGDGCGPDLDWWLSDEAAEALLQRLKPREPAPPKKLPPACMDILKAR